MTLANSLIYMFEFVIDDLVIVKQNLCAPEEYPTCVELSFRSNVFISICDRQFGSCVHPRQPKCGKCCIFALDSPVQDKDVLMIHVYKKKTQRCKFLIGTTTMPVKAIFDRVKRSFDIENPNWEKIWIEQAAILPTIKGPNKETLDNCSCYDPGMERFEQLCPTSELTKRLLPLFNLCKQQTGNIVIKMRLLCNGPSIVSCFALNQAFCSRNPKCPEPCCKPDCGSDPCCPPACPPPCEPAPCCPSATGPADYCKNCCRSSCAPSGMSQCVQPDPCARPAPHQGKCLRYFACNLDKLCPCDYCEDEFDRECPTVPTKRCVKPSGNEPKVDCCGPCAGIPAHPRWVQKRKEDKRAGDRAEKKEKEKAIKQDEKRKKGGRQEGGAISSDIPYTVPQASRANSYYDSTPCSVPAATKCSCSNLYRSNGFSTSTGCCPDYENCCESARNRAMRKLHHLLVKYNINVE